VSGQFHAMCLLNTKSGSSEFHYMGVLLDIPVRSLGMFTLYCSNIYRHCGRCLIQHRSEKQRKI
jgi:hypothetical protein